MPLRQKIECPTRTMDADAQILVPLNYTTAKDADTHPLRVRPWWMGVLWSISFGAYRLLWALPIRTTPSGDTGVASIYRWHSAIAALGAGWLLLILVMLGSSGVRRSRVRTGAAFALACSLTY